MTIGDIVPIGSSPSARYKTNNSLFTPFCSWNSNKNTKTYTRTSVSDSRWRHFYSVSGTKAQCESAL